jgi:hypothetical protein
LNFAAPADTTLFAVYVPGDAKVEKFEGLEMKKAGGMHGEEGKQLLKAAAMKNGAGAVLELSGLKPPVVVKEAELPEGTDLNLPRPAGRK